MNDNDKMIILTIAIVKSIQYQEGSKMYVGGKLDCFLSKIPTQKF